MTAAAIKTPRDPKQALTKSQTDLLMAISGKSCAWRSRSGWRPKTSSLGFARATGDALIGLGLAEVAYGKGNPRLILSPLGEAIALEIKAERQKIAEARKGLQPKNEQELRDLIELIKRELEALSELTAVTGLHAAADKIVEKLCSDHGARERCYAGTNSLRMAGITASCTAGSYGLLQNWVSAARRKLLEGAL